MSSFLEREAARISGAKTATKKLPSKGTRKVSFLERERQRVAEADAKRRKELPPLIQNSPFNTNILEEIVRTAGQVPRRQPNLIEESRDRLRSITPTVKPTVVAKNPTEAMLLAMWGSGPDDDEPIGKFLKNKIYKPVVKPVGEIVLEGLTRLGYPGGEVVKTNLDIIDKIRKGDVAGGLADIASSYRGSTGGPLPPIFTKPFVKGAGKAVGIGGKGINPSEALAEKGYLPEGPLGLVLAIAADMAGTAYVPGVGGAKSAAAAAAGSKVASKIARGLRSTDEESAATTAIKELSERFGTSARVAASRAGESNAQKFFRLQPNRGPDLPVTAPKRKPRRVSDPEKLPYLPPRGAARPPRGPLGPEERALLGQAFARQADLSMERSQRLTGIRQTAESGRVPKINPNASDEQLALVQGGRAALEAMGRKRFPQLVPTRLTGSGEKLGAAGVRLSNAERTAAERLAPRPPKPAHIPARELKQRQQTFERMFTPERPQTHAQAPGGALEAGARPDVYRQWGKGRRKTGTATPLAERAKLPPRRESPYPTAASVAVSRSQKMVDDTNREVAERVAQLSDSVEPSIKLELGKLAAAIDRKAAAQYDIERTGVHLRQTGYFADDELEAAYGMGPLASKLSPREAKEITRIQSREARAKRSLATADAQIARIIKRAEAQLPHIMDGDVASVIEAAQRAGVAQKAYADATKAARTTVTEARRRLASANRPRKTRPGAPSSEAAKHLLEPGVSPSAPRSAPTAPAPSSPKVRPGQVALIPEGLAPKGMKSVTYRRGQVQKNIERVDKEIEMAFNSQLGKAVGTAAVHLRQLDRKIGRDIRKMLRKKSDNGLLGTVEQRQMYDKTFGNEAWQEFSDDAYKVIDAMESARAETPLGLSVMFPWSDEVLFTIPFPIPARGSHLASAVAAQGENFEKSQLFRYFPHLGTTPDEVAENVKSFGEEFRRYIVSEYGPNRKVAQLALQLDKRKSYANALIAREIQRDSMNLTAKERKLATWYIEDTLSDAERAALTPKITDYAKRMSKITENNADIATHAGVSMKRLKSYVGHFSRDRKGRKLAELIARHGGEVPDQLVWGHTPGFTYDRVSKAALEALGIESPWEVGTIRWFNEAFGLKMYDDLGQSTIMRAWAHNNAMSDLAMTRTIERSYGGKGVHPLSATDEVQVGNQRVPGPFADSEIKVPLDVVETLNRIATARQRAATRFGVRLAVSGNRQWKKLALFTLGYDIRNFLGDMFLASQEGQGAVRSSVRGLMVAKGSDKPVRSLGEAISDPRRKRDYSGRLTYKQVKDEASTYGAAGSGLLPFETKGVTEAEAMMEKLHLSSFIPKSIPIANKLRGKSLARARVAREDILRRGVYATQRAIKGKHPYAATQKVYKTFYDYSDVGRGVDWMRRSPFGAPFGTWLAKNIPAQVRRVGSNPGQLARFQAVRGNLEEEYNKDPLAQLDLMPDYLKRQLPFKVPGVGAVSIAVPFADINKLSPSISQRGEKGPLGSPFTADDIKSFGREWVSSLGFPIQAGGVLLGQNLLTGRSIKDVVPRTAPMELLQKLDELAPGPEVFGGPSYARITNKEGKKEVVAGASGWTDALLSELLPVYGHAGRTLASTQDGVENPWLKLLSAQGGISITKNPSIGNIVSQLGFIKIERNKKVGELKKQIVNELRGAKLSGVNPAWRIRGDKYGFAVATGDVPGSVRSLADQYNRLNEKLIKLKMAGAILQERGKDGG